VVHMAPQCQPEAVVEFENDNGGGWLVKRNGEREAYAGDLIRACAALGINLWERNVSAHMVDCETPKRI